MTSMPKMDVSDAAWRRVTAEVGPRPDTFSLALDRMLDRLAKLEARGGVGGEEKKQ